MVIEFVRGIAIFTKFFGSVFRTYFPNNAKETNNTDRYTKILV
jgi:hypothetical protein